MAHLDGNAAVVDRFLIFHPFNQQHTASLRDAILGFCISHDIPPQNLIGIHLKNALGFSFLPNRFQIELDVSRPLAIRDIEKQIFTILDKNQLVGQDSPLWILLDMSWLNLVQNPFQVQREFQEILLSGTSNTQNNYIFHFNLASISPSIIHQSFPLYPQLYWQNRLTQNAFYLNEADTQETDAVCEWLTDISLQCSESHQDNRAAVYFHNAFENFPHPIIEADYSVIIQELDRLKQSFPDQWKIMLQDDLQYTINLMSKLSIRHANQPALQWLNAKNESDFFFAFPDKPSHLFIIEFQEHIIQLAEGVFPITLSLDMLSLSGKDINIILDVLPFESGNYSRMLMISQRSNTHMVKGLLEHSLYKISQLVHTQQDLDSLYVGIHEILNQFVNAKNFYIALITQDDQYIKFSYHVDEMDQLPVKGSIHSGKIDYVIKTGETLWVDEETDKTNIKKGKYKPIGASASQWMGVPLKTAEKTIGVIVIQTYDGLPLTEHDKFVMEFCSSQIALAIERKTAQNELKENQQQLFQILLGSSVPTRVIDHNRKTFHINHAYENFCGISANHLLEIENRPWISMQHPDLPSLPCVVATGATANEIADIYGQKVSAYPLIDGAYIWENMHIRTAKGDHWVTLTAAPLKDIEGNTIGAIENLLDITQRIHAEDEIRVFKAVAEYANIGMFVADMNKEIIYINPYMASKLGYSTDDLLHQPVSIIFRQNSAMMDTLIDELIDKKKELRDVKINFQNKDFQELPFLINAVKIETQHDQKSWISFSCFNISRHKKREDALNRYANRLEILHKIDEAILEATSTDEIIQNAMQIVLQLVKYDHASIFELQDEQTINIYQGILDAGKFTESILLDQFCAPQMIAKLQSTEIYQLLDPVEIKNEFSCMFLTQNIDIQSCIIIPLIVKHQVIGRFMVGFTNSHALSDEISEIIKEVSKMISIGIYQTRLYEKVEAMATIDELTGIYNRRQLIELGEKAFAQVKRSHKPFSVIIFDIDHFKEVNDNYGHTTGDKVLKSVVKRCQGIVRQMDVFGRYGGDEFVVILPETGLDQAESVAIRLKDSVYENQLTLNECPIKISISVGISTFMDKGETLTQLINNADNAMYDAKKSGRNRIILYKNSS
ncbi:MAG: diguanylate cyclase [Anaerolineaceae bacterium]|nr:diguanylate cyclase [Anaerolineaceae bacterium]